MAKGYTQKKGVGYNEIFLPVVKYTTNRVMLALVANFDWELEQLEVKTACLHAELNEQIFMNQPKGFKEKLKFDHVCFLKRSLYGLKKSPRQWYKRFDYFVLTIGFQRSKFDHCLYFQYDDANNDCVFLLLYVDDMLLVGSSPKWISKMKTKLNGEFITKDQGKAKRIICMEIERDTSNSVLFLHQSSYISNVLKKFGMHDCKLVKSPLANHFVLSKY